MPIGPQLPPSVEKRKRSNGSDQSDSDDSDDSVGPQLPKDAEETATKKARVLGRALPPTLDEYLPESAKQDAPRNDNSDGEDDDDDDDFGPSLPTEADLDKAKNMSATDAAQSKSTESNSTVTQNKRDEWMTIAPTSGDWSQRIDPTKLKNRKFNTGKSSSNVSSGTDAWHETPEQKQARLKREVLGIRDEKSSKAQPSIAAESQSDAETARRMNEYKKQRGPSLYDSHQKGQKTEEEDDPSARAFDREKDIGGGLQINATQRREMMKKSSDFNSRFSSAKYL